MIQLKSYLCFVNIVAVICLIRYDLPSGLALKIEICYTNVKIKHIRGKFMNLTILDVEGFY